MANRYAIGALLAAALAGCSPARVCVPGVSVACVAPGGCAGGQVCASDGQSFSACECAVPADAGPSLDGGADAPDGAADTSSVDTSTVSDALDATDVGPVASDAAPDPGGPSCASDAVCESIAAELSCDTAVGRCVAGVSCETNSECGAAEACTARSCRLSLTLCQYDRECAGGTSCVDGRCLPLCTLPRDCAAGLNCIDGFCDETPTPCACASDRVCSPVGCAMPCSTDGACGVQRFCDHGACRAGLRTTPRCALDTDCAAGRVCRSGVCRTPCTTAASPSTTCTMIDGTLPNCRLDAPSGDLLCFAVAETMPECSRSADCATGELCINATCR